MIQIETKYSEGDLVWFNLRGKYIQGKIECVESWSRHLGVSYRLSISYDNLTSWTATESDLFDNENDVKENLFNYFTEPSDSESEDILPTE